jgi:hypothetical protein
MCGFGALPCFFADDPGSTYHNSLAVAGIMIFSLLALSCACYWILGWALRLSARLLLDRDPLDSGKE